MHIEQLTPFDEDECADHGVYILLGDVNGAIACKVGMSSYIQSRIYQVCQICPFELSHAYTLGAKSRLEARVAERALLRMLRPYRARGEWFMFDPSDAGQKSSLYACINAVAELRGMTKVSLSLAEIRATVAAIKASHKSDEAERRERAARAIPVRRQEKAAQIEARRAKALQFENDALRQRTEALAGRTLMV